MNDIESHFFPHHLVFLIFFARPQRKAEGVVVATALVAMWSSLVVGIVCAATLASAIRVLKSKVKVGGGGDGEDGGGARLVDERRVAVEDLTICVRFNVPVSVCSVYYCIVKSRYSFIMNPYAYAFIQVLGSFGHPSRIVTIEDRHHPTEEDDDFHMDSVFSLFYFQVSYPKNFFGFGHPVAEGSFKSFLLQDADTDEWEIWATNQWTHLCFAYRKRDGYLKVIKVRLSLCTFRLPASSLKGKLPQDGKALSVNGPNPDLTEVEVPEDFLGKVALGRCNVDSDNGCSPPEGQITDFNMWDTFLDTPFLEDWTQCRLQTTHNHLESSSTVVYVRTTP